MSEINPFAIALLLPIAAAKHFSKLAGLIGTNEFMSNKKYNWPSNVEREELLRNSYQYELTKLQGNLSLIKNNPVDLLITQQNHLKAMLHSIQKVDNVNVVLNTKYSNQFNTAKNNLLKLTEAIRQASQSKKDLIELSKQTDSQLRELTLKAQSIILDIELESTSEIMSESLHSLGYRLRKKQNVLVGSMGELTLKAEILSGGNIVLDTRSFGGFRCHKEVARLENKLKEDGIVLRRLLNPQTNKKEGVLIKDPFPSMETIDVSAVELQTISQQTNGSSEQEQQNYVRNRNCQREKQLVKEV